MKAVNRVFLNTGVTYAKAIITSVISLYATRLILDALGASDYGLYNVIGGMIAMLSFLNAAMTTSTQRFLSFNLGTNNFEKVKKIFANSLIIHFVIGLCVAVGIEIIGYYLIKNHLKIDADKIEIALLILHFLVGSTFFTIVSVPYEAVMIANENMTFLAVLGVVNAVLKIIIAFSIYSFADDRLYYYGLFIMLATIAIVFVKRIYSKKKYKECNIKILDFFEKEEVKELTSFAGWSLFGTLCSLARNQGVSVVINLFYATVVNAAYGVANQINGQLMFFSQTMMSALRPQIMKSEGANNRERMIRLALTANKFSFFLFTLFAVPFFFEMSTILKFWLNDVPNYTVEFCRAIILLTMMNQANMGLMSAVQAIGKIKVYQIVAGSIQLLTLPIGFIALKLGYPPYSIIFISFILESVSTVFRIFYFKYLTGFSKKKYFITVIFKPFTCLALIIFLIFTSKKYLDLNWITLMSVYIITTIIYMLLIYFYGISKKERNMVSNLFQTIKNKILTR